MHTMTVTTKLSMSFVLILAVLPPILYKIFGTFEGGPHHPTESQPIERPIPEDAIPIYSTPNLHPFIRYFLGYLNGVILPVGTMIKCPVSLSGEAVLGWERIDLEQIGGESELSGDKSKKVNSKESLESVENAKQCMKKGRDSAQLLDTMINFRSNFWTEDIFLRRSNMEEKMKGKEDNEFDGTPLQITLFRKKNKQKGKKEGGNGADVQQELVKRAPLILFIHGGGFTTKALPYMVTDKLFGALLNIDQTNTSITSDSMSVSMMEHATWAVVHYRLAPEYPYPAATNDCLSALQYLVLERGLGKGGTHIAGSSAGGALAMEVTLKSLQSFSSNGNGAVGGVDVDTFYVDEPMVPLLDNSSTASSASKRPRYNFNYPSFRQATYTRSPPVAWLEWSLKAYAGTDETYFANAENEYLVNTPYGQVSTDVDITGGAMTVKEWTKAYRARNLEYFGCLSQKESIVHPSGKDECAKKSPKYIMPSLFLITSNGDPLQDGGLAFKNVYEEVAREVSEMKENLLNQDKFTSNVCDTQECKGSSVNSETCKICGNDLRKKNKIVHVNTLSGHGGFYLLEPSTFHGIMMEWFDEMYFVWMKKNNMEQ